MTDPSSVGAGQLTPFDGNSEYSAIAFICRQLIARLDVMKPCRVKTVHAGQGTPPAAGTVDVDLLVSLLDGSGNAVKQGTVYGLPYTRLQGGPWAVVLDPAVNDVGFVVCSDRDMSALATAAAANQDLHVTPGSNRSYSVSDGVYVGGIFNQVPAATLWLKPDGSFVLTDKSGNVLQGTASGITLTPASGQPITLGGPLVVNGDLRLQGSIKAQDGTTYAGNITTAGEVTARSGANFVTLSGHQHSALNAPPTPGH